MESYPSIVKILNNNNYNTNIYSPFDNEIRRRKITSYQNEVARLEAELSEIQKQIDNGAPETEIGPRPSESYLILNFDENNNRVPTKLARRKLEIQEEITDYQNRISNHEAVLRDRGLIPVEGE
jgi:peptidoglycan hydrolase CwlO-like protein